MKTISRYIMTLALLLTAVTGAWAEDPKVYDSGDVELFSLQAGDILMPGVTLKNSDVNNLAGVNLISNRYSIDGVISQYSNSISSIPFSIGENGLLTAELAGEGPYNCMPITKDGKAGNAWVVTDVFEEPNYKTILICGTTYPAASGPKVEWTASTKTGTFTMPGSDVVLTPIYAKAAAFATTGTEPEAKTLLPEAAEGVIAGTDASLIAEGTGIVAFAGTSTEVTQGTLMYAIGTSATEAPALTEFSATVPTAENVADDGADVYVWYYIKGADAPDGQQATEENTFNDTEPACLTVTVLTNKFDIQFNAANANTIEAGKATVTVGGTAATVTEGKLQGVKMGSEVKMTAKDGYKFRKVEVKKASMPTLNITSPEVGQIIGSDGKNYTSGTLPTGVTAVAKICYVSGSNGLALALTDEEGTMNWSTAQTTCAAHTAPFTGGTWKLATKDEWDSMISAAGSYDDLRDGFSSVGGTNMQSGIYWSSTEYEDDSSKAYYNDFYGGYYNVFSKGNNARVRACLAF